MNEITPLWNEARTSYEAIFKAMSFYGRMWSPTDLSSHIGRKGIFELCEDLRPQAEGNSDFYLHPERIERRNPQSVAVMTDVSCMVLIAMLVQNGISWVPNGLQLWREAKPWTNKPGDIPVVYGFTPAAVSGNSSYRLEVVRSNVEPVLLVDNHGTIAPDDYEFTAGGLQIVKDGSMAGVEALLEWAVGTTKK